MTAASVTQLIPEATYPELLPLLPELAKAAPYPIDKLPQTMRDAAHAIAYHVQAPVELSAQCVIGAAAYLAQSRINAPHIHLSDGMPAALFMLTLADSGDRKSETRRLAFKTIDEAEKEARQAHRKECDEISSFADSLKANERDKFLAEHPLQPDPRTQFSDATFEPIAGAFIRGMTAASWDTDEGGQMLGGSSLKADTRAATLGGLVKAFDNGCIERTRASGNMEGSGFAFNRRLSIHLLAQQITVAAALNDPLLQGQGFLPRFLFASPESIAGTRLLTADRMKEKAYLDTRLQTFWNRCMAIQATPQQIDHDTNEVKPPVIAMASDAQSEWMNFYNETERKQSPLGEYAEIKPFAGRAGELTRRLAAVLAYFEGKAEIDTGFMESACAIVRHSLNEWARYMGSAKPDAKLVQAAALMEWLRAKGWLEFHRDKLGKEGPTRSSAKARDQLLSILCRHNHLISSDGKQFRINPRCSAEIAEIAETYQVLSISNAEGVRRGAENPEAASKLVETEEKPAVLRTSSAQENLVNAVVSAESAKSARDSALKPIYRGEL